MTQSQMNADANRYMEQMREKLTADPNNIVNMQTYNDFLDIMKNFKQKLVFDN